MKQNYYTTRNSFIRSGKLRHPFRILTHIPQVIDHIELVFPPLRTHFVFFVKNLMSLIASSTLPDNSVFFIRGFKTSITFF